MRTYVCLCFCVQVRESVWVRAYAYVRACEKKPKRVLVANHDQDTFLLTESCGEEMSQTGTPERLCVRRCQGCVPHKKF